MDRSSDVKAKIIFEIKFKVIQSKGEEVLEKDSPQDIAENTPPIIAKKSLATNRNKSSGGITHLLKERIKGS